jgi:hypothetical protein
MSENLIRVLVHAKQNVSYDQTLSFTPEEWQEFKDMDCRAQGDELTGRLDLRDVSDRETIEEFEATVVDAKGKPLSPLDQVENY